MTIETHPIYFYPDIRGLGTATFEDVEARFNVTRECPDRGVGINSWTVQAELIDFKIGNWTVTRDMLCEMISRAEVDAIEARVAESISYSEAA